MKGKNVVHIGIVGRVNSGSLDTKSHFILLDILADLIYTSLQTVVTDANDGSETPRRGLGGKKRLCRAPVRRAYAAGNARLLGAPPRDESALPPVCRAVRLRLPDRQKGSAGADDRKVLPQTGHLVLHKLSFCLRRKKGFRIARKPFSLACFYSP